MLDKSLTKKMYRLYKEFESNVEIFDEICIPTLAGDENAFLEWVWYPEPNPNAWGHMALCPPIGVPHPDINWGAA